MAIEINPIKNFFCDQEVFITGASGLIGKSVVEKLLRSCPGIKRIYLLLRKKHGICSAERLEKFKQSQIFDLIRGEGRSDDLNKLVAVCGDIGEINLGLSIEDLNRLQNVSIIFHIAATIRFDEPLKNAILQNVRGTRETLRIAEGLKNIKSFVHCSTAYSNPYRIDIDEKLYDMYSDWEHCIKIAEEFDQNSLDALTSKMINNFPNTYTFSKHVAEHLVNSFKNRVPVAIFRPTIVTNSIREPFPGWYDSFIGAVGFSVGAGLGLIRIVNGNPRASLDCIPLDIVVKLFIIIAWKDSSLPPLKSEENVRIYNLSSGKYLPQFLEQQFSQFFECLKKIPFDKTIWVPRLTFCSNKFFFRLQVLLFHFMPGIFLDLLVRLTGNKPFILNVHRKIAAAQNCLLFFMHNSFKFENNRVDDMLDEVEKISDFDLKYAKEVPLTELYQSMVMGLRKFLLKESDDNSKALWRYKILQGFDTGIFYIFYFWIIIKCFNILLTFYDTNN